MCACCVSSMAMYSMHVVYIPSCGPNKCIHCVYCLLSSLLEDQHLV